MLAIGSIQYSLSDYLYSASFRVSSSQSFQPTSEQRHETSWRKTAKKQGVSPGAPVFIRIFKEESVLELWLRGTTDYRLVKVFPICKYSGSLGPKQKEGDRQAPEGFYEVKTGQLNPNSNYHLAFNIGYPNVYDQAHQRTGSYIMVHGDCVSIGCFAMTDPGIDEIYAAIAEALDSGQKAVPVHVFPFRMTAAAMTKYSDSKWFSFWSNLREGYDLFEQSHQPPVVWVDNKRYQFSKQL